MPCSCVPGCSCGSAAACAGSACIGAGFAGAHIMGMSGLVGGYHSMWYGGRTQVAVPGDPTPEEQEEIRAELRERDVELLERLQEKLRRVEAETPGGVLRSAHHLDREKEKLQERIRRLEHEISVFEG